MSTTSPQRSSRNGRSCFTQSLGHNPTGGSITLPVAHAVLPNGDAIEPRDRRGRPVADLPMAVNSRLATLDQLNNVISIGTFSKTLSASLRSGLHRGAAATSIATLAELKMLTTVNSSGHVERLLHRLLADGHYDRHLKRLGQRSEAAMGQVRANLVRGGHRLYADARAGYYLYLLLPDRIDDMALAREGAKDSIFIASGSLFCLDKNSRAGARDQDQCVAGGQSEILRISAAPAAIDAATPSGRFLGIGGASTSSRSRPRAGVGSTSAAVGDRIQMRMHQRHRLVGVALLERFDDRDVLADAAFR